MPRVARRRPAPRAIGSTARASWRDVVAERLAEAARLHEVALHVDDEKRGRSPVEALSVGSGLGDDDAQCRLG